MHVAVRIAVDRAVAIVTIVVVTAAQLLHGHVVIAIERIQRRQRQRRRLHGRQQLLHVLLHVAVLHQMLQLMRRRLAGRR